MENHNNLRIGFLGEHTIRYSLYTAVVVLILTLTGIFSTFAGRDIIQNRLSMDTIALLLMIGIPAFIASTTLLDSSLPLKVINGAIAGWIASAAISIVIVLETLVPQQDLVFVFNNYRPIIGGVATFGYEGDAWFTGVTLLMLFGLILGGVVGAIQALPSRVQHAFYGGLGSMVVIGLISNQVRDLMTPADSVAIILALIAGYIASRILIERPLWLRLVIGLAAGAVFGFIMALLANGGAFAQDGSLLLGGDQPVILLGPDQPFVMLPIIFGLIGLSGALITTSTTFVHNSAAFLAVVLLLLGMLNVQQRMTDIMAVATFVVFALAIWLLPPLGQRANQFYDESAPAQRKTVTRLTSGLALALALVAPIFMGQYITNVLDLVMLYIIMGLGLNVMVGYAGLLDLGYVASFAIGAYTSAILTTPSIVTTGCVPLDVAQGTHYFDMCTGILENWQGIGLLTFWTAWPIAILVSAFTGMALGIPVLRLRGDYLAIVTLGFGEMTRVLTRAQITAPLLGAAQGISPVPFPVIDLTSINPSWYFELSNASTIYYLYVFSVLAAALIVWRLAGSRLGRAWRAMKADEDVAQAMGVPLVRTKLLAFGISSAFAGLGGAIFAAQLRGIFPDSFTLMVSVNVLSLIIIGGLGSIPGIVLGALMLVGLPELLRELQDYRLLVFGALLVGTMLLKPEGLIPPPIRQLSQRVTGEKNPTSSQPSLQGADQ
ncbi:hypothetical protein G4Y79_13195 [Phototrophicus methaneseepsis]|uniref:Uncharacterized protein n=1 Tax=Phototrophicus methaneseepsis TaxID=2710758 RepID=A0A7S8IDC9_9CHLR|nr:hypothetical protein [Phototrophicus methaneseepsis]QPC80668.1 hypothetical protein G4Y79_13195 [Phototrophicus methaneseepsis]